MAEAYHRKYRSKRLSEYIGNQAVKDGVQAMLRSDVRPQVVLIDGHSGCGKTTMGRLLSKEYSCTNRDEIFGSCGVCDNCKAFDEFIEDGNDESLMNMREINCGTLVAADCSRIIMEMEAPSIDGGWKTFIFDEAHLLSSKTMGNLLKSIEEPPDQVLIVLCTTNPEDLLDTILSRCQRKFHIQKPTRKELCSLLAYVCESENIKYEDKALSAICTSGDYVPRNCLINLETVINGTGAVTYENTTATFKTVSDEYYYNFFEYMTADAIDVYAYINFIGGIKDNMPVSQFMDGLINFTKRGLYIYNGVKVDGVDKEEIDRCKAIFTSFNSAEIANILITLLSIAKVNDDTEKEVRLLLLGYTGLRKLVGVVRSTEVIKPVENASAVAVERSHANANKDKACTPTAEDVQALIDKTSDIQDVSTMVKLFDGATFVGDINKLK